MRRRTWNVESRLISWNLTPKGLRGNVVESSPTELSFVIPPKATDERSGDDLEGVAGGFNMPLFNHISYSISTFGLGFAVCAAVSKGSVTE